MSSPHAKNDSQLTDTSLSNSEEELRRRSPESAPEQNTAPLNDENLIRETLNAAIKRSGKSRDQIADEMSFYLGCQVTRRSLELYTAESATQNRFPLQYARAFCQATNDLSLLRVLPELAGLQIIGPDEQALMELGRQYLLEKRAASKLAALEKRLSEVDL